MKKIITKYDIIFLPEAISDLKKIDKIIAQRIIDKVKWLSENFSETVPLKLSFSLKGLYKLRVGDWRIIYSADLKKELITIHMVGHRKEIYK